MSDIKLLQPSPPVDINDVKYPVLYGYQKHPDQPVADSEVDSLIIMCWPICHDRGDFLAVGIALDDVKKLYQKAQQSRQELVTTERAFKNGWSCGYMTGGKDQHVGNMSGSPCAEDLAAYKNKILPSPPKEK